MIEFLQRRYLIEMKKILIAFLTLILIIVGSCVFVGCKEQKTNVIRLNEVTHSVFYAPLYVAINQNYFSEQGLKIELTNGGGADKTMTAVISGQADIGFCGPEAVIYVYNEGRKDYPKVFAQLTAMDGSFLIGRTNEKFDWTKSLIGKEIIGGRKGGVPAMSLEYALTQAGYTIGKDVTINYDVQFDLITAAFESGVGDYCTMFEPGASAYQKAGKGYVLDSVGVHSGKIPYTCFCATQKYLESNKENIEKFVTALKKGVKFVAEKGAREIAEVVAPSFSGTDIDLLVSAIENYKRIGAYVNKLSMEKEDFDRLQQIIISSGVYDEPADFYKIVDNSFVE